MRPGRRIRQPVGRVRARHLRIAGPLAAAMVVTVAGAACGEASARIVAAAESPISFEIPVDYTPLESDGGSAVEFFGLPGSSTATYGTDPVLSLMSLPGGDDASFVNLRSMAVSGRFDPLDTEDPAVAEVAQVLGYTEFGDPDVWGLRLRLLLTNGVSDFQALVDRRSDRIAVSALNCTQACFIEQAELIDQIQRSWSLDHD